jgi:hypothetical protein
MNLKLTPLLYVAVYVTALIVLYHDLFIWRP